MTEATAERGLSGVGSVCPTAVVMVRPHHFTSNPDTQADNSFQSAVDAAEAATIAASAHDEITAAAAALTERGVTVHLFEDVDTATPDSVFPNNWLSTHPDGRVALYPMCAPSRRLERRRDVIDALAEKYWVRSVTDYSCAERDGQFLEGTGAMVLDQAAKVAYVSRSQRAHETVLERFCADFGYEAVLFDSVGADGTPVYHTNVVMCVGERFALVGADMITDVAQRETVLGRLRETGHEVVEVSAAQIGEFAGNALEVHGSAGSVLAISTRAVAALTQDQLATLAAHTNLLPLSIPTVELAGGSVRCTLAGVHLPPR